MENSLISIILPIYNAEKYLNKCVESILNQKYTNLELIMIDDGSTDSSFNICQSFSKDDKRIVLIHKDNEGRCKARNLGIDKANGKYIMFVDDDDLIDEMYLFDMHQLIASYDADIACCKYTKIVDYQVPKLNNKCNNNIQVYTGNEILKEYFHPNKSDIYANVWTKIYKKELFDTIKYENETFEDLFITYQLLSKANKVVCTDNSYYFYNVSNSNSLTYQFDRSRRINEREKYIDLVSNFFKNNDEIRNELIFHLMEEYITIHNDIIHSSDINMKKLANKNKQVRKWIIKNINSPIFTIKDRIKIVLRVYFHKIWHILKQI